MRDKELKGQVQNLIKRCVVLNDMRCFGHFCFKKLSIHFLMSYIKLGTIFQNQIDKCNHH